MRLALIFVAGISVLPARSSQVQTNPEVATQNFPCHYDVRVELVGLFASVLDRSGKPVRDLNQSDFVLLEDGRPQIISQFSREYIPLSVLFLLDTSGSMEGEKLHNARKSLVQFLKHLNRGDEAMLMEFRAKPKVVRPFTRDFGRIEKELKHLEGSGSTALYDAILAALDQMQAAQNRRRAVLLISDGINTYGKARLEDTMSSLKRRGVELFTIGLETDLSEEAQDRLMTRTVFDRLTQSAGGEAFVISDSRDLKRICAIISEHMHNQYSFGYYPQKTNEGWRAIRLETKTRGFRVIVSKTGYFASKNPEPAADCREKLTTAD